MTPSSDPHDPQAGDGAAAGAAPAADASRRQRTSRAHGPPGAGRGGRRPSAGKRRSGSAFYAGVLDALDRENLASATAVRGIDQEIAVLRLRIRRLLSDQPEDYALIVRSLDLLVRAVGASGRLATDDTDEALDRIYAELGGIVDLIAESGDTP